ncbi:MAG: thioredoxin domain-containing protein, partial [Bryobacterales bacterium]
RYATDARWLVPHFEKMLYDNALLTVSYLEGYQATERADFARVAREILRYVERDMTSSEGAFYSATDADSPNPAGEREEGWFFTWTPAEIDAALNPEQARLVKAYYHVTNDGNFEGRSILNVTRPLEEVARELDITAAEARNLLDASREALYEQRNKRPPPLRDEKILTSWNGLMISAHAFAALVLDEPDYARRAGKAAGFILEAMRRDGRLLRSYKDGQASHNAYLDDYAFLTAGLIDLYEATGDLRWLREAIALDAVLAEHYEDRENGGFFLTSGDHESLLAREKPSYDGAEPSGNSVAVLNLLRLHEFTTEDDYRVRAERALKAFEGILSSTPIGLSDMLLALDFHLDAPKEILLVMPRSREEAQALIQPLRTAFVPNRIMAVVAEGAQLDEHAAVAPLLKDKRAIGGRPTAYVCERRICELPTSDPAVLAEQISRVESYGKGLTAESP